jgi:uncharacterized protein (DUF2062 family)
MVRISPDSIKRDAALWLRQGISPSRLAFTLALGFVLGCMPVVGLATALCAALAVALELNLPAIEAANYAAWPLQLGLIVPFVRLGRWLPLSGQPQPAPPSALLHLSLAKLVAQTGGLAGRAMLAWLLVAIPAIALMTLTLTPVLRRIPVLAAAGGED